MIIGEARERESTFGGDDGVASLVLGLRIGGGLHLFPFLGCGVTMIDDNICLCGVGVATSPRRIHFLASGCHLVLEGSLGATTLFLILLLPELIPQRGGDQVGLVVVVLVHDAQRMTKCRHCWMRPSEL